MPKNPWSSGKASWEQFPDCFQRPLCFLWLWKICMDVSRTWPVKWVKPGDCKEEWAEPWEVTRLPSMWQCYMHLFCLCICMWCVCGWMFNCVVHIYLCMCVCVLDEAWSGYQRSFLIALYFVYWGKVSYWTQNLPVIPRLYSQFTISASRAWVTGSHHVCLAVVWVPGSELWSLYLCRKWFIN